MSTTDTHITMQAVIFLSFPKSDFLFLHAVKLKANFQLLTRFIYKKRLIQICFLKYFIQKIFLVINEY